jgi:hypothetical protein
METILHFWAQDNMQCWKCVCTYISRFLHSGTISWKHVLCWDCSSVFARCICGLYGHQRRLCQATDSSRCKSENADRQFRGLQTRKSVLDPTEQIPTTGRAANQWCGFRTEAKRRRNSTDALRKRTALRVRTVAVMLNRPSTMVSHSLPVTFRN